MSDPRPITSDDPAPPAFARDASLRATPGSAPTVDDALPPRPARGEPLRDAETGPGGVSPAAAAFLLLMVALGVYLKFF